MAIPFHYPQVRIIHTVPNPHPLVCEVTNIGGD